MMNAPVLSWALDLASVAVAIAMALCAWRLWRGPETTDRILALDTLYINGLALIILFGVWLASDIFFEAALLIAVMGFVSTVAVAKHLLHGDIID